MTEPAHQDRSFKGSWGAAFTRDGHARFRLWAPQVQKLALRLDGHDIDMVRDQGGWFELTVPGAEPGLPYQFVLPNDLAVPDPASRAQRGDVHGPSVLTDPGAYRWRNSSWTGRPWREAVIYELHVGTFTPHGTFPAATERLEHLARLGVTAIEIMPVGQFPGTRGWGYDGVLPYAPHVSYGAPEDMKQFIDEAHGLGLMVLLDVVYNHFGPEGNYLHAYAEEFFDSRRRTPWGPAIAYRRDPVRAFFVENAVYWLQEFNLDGLRLDAVDQIHDVSDPELLVEIAQRVEKDFPHRHVHLTTEDNRNVTYLHTRRSNGRAHYTGEWNDDFHNAAHVLLTGEDEGYYKDFADDPTGHLARCLAEGFSYQGQPSFHGGGEPRGEDSKHLPSTTFIDFLQNHDQVGNRALGERLTVLADRKPLFALTAVMLLSPHTPLLFMGEEWDETRPFNFFTDFSGDLAEAVKEGRRKEFAGFSAFSSPDLRVAIPDPNDLATFTASRIDWNKLSQKHHADHLAAITALLAARREHVVPLLNEWHSTPAKVQAAQEGAIAIDWQFEAGLLELRANLSGKMRQLPASTGHVIHDTVGGAVMSAPASREQFQPWRVVVAVRP